MQYNTAIAHTANSCQMAVNMPAHYIGSSNASSANSLNHSTLTLQVVAVRRVILLSTLKTKSEIWSHYSTRTFNETLSPSVKTLRCGVLLVAREGKGESLGELSHAVGAKVKERSKNWQHWCSSHCVIWTWQTAESQGGSPPFSSFRKILHQAMMRGHLLSQPSSDTNKCSQITGPERALYRIQFNTVL